MRRLHRYVSTYARPARSSLEAAANRDEPKGAAQDGDANPCEEECVCAKAIKCTHCMARAPTQSEQDLEAKLVKIHNRMCDLRKLLVRGLDYEPIAILEDIFVLLGDEREQKRDENNCIARSHIPCPVGRSEVAVQVEDDFDDVDFFSGPSHGTMARTTSFDNSSSRGSPVPLCGIAGVGPGEAESILQKSLAVPPGMPILPPRPLPRTPSSPSSRFVRSEDLHNRITPRSCAVFLPCLLRRDIQEKAPRVLARTHVSGLTCHITQYSRNKSRGKQRKFIYTFAGVFAKTLTGAVWSRLVSVEFVLERFRSCRFANETSGRSAPGK